jgi:hypothetical protein
MNLKNKAATEALVQIEYPNEKFISSIEELQTLTIWTENLIIPKNVKLAVSRIPINAYQYRILRKELRQAEILTREGYCVYLIPEHGGYGEKLKDAIVNGELFEFRNVTGQSRKIERRFKEAKEKGADTNVFINIDLNVSIRETKRRISLVLNRHPEYTGKIIISIQGDKTYFWDTLDFRSKNPALRQGSLPEA